MTTTRYGGAYWCVNHVVLGGYVAKPPYYTPEGGCKCEAINIPMLVKVMKWDKSTNAMSAVHELHYQVVVYGHAAGVLNGALATGDRILVTGYLSAQDWTDKAGRQRTAIQVRASEVINIGPAGNGGADAPRDAVKVTAADFRRAGSGNAPARPAKAPEPFTVPTHGLEEPW